MKKTVIKTSAVFIAAFCLFFFSGCSFVLSDAQQLQYRTDEMSTSVAGATATHTISFQITDDSDPLGSIKFQFCQNDPIPNFPCTAPTGFDDSGAILASQSGDNTGFTISSDSTSSVIILTRSPSVPDTSINTYEFSNIVNPSIPGSFYIRLYTYPTTDASGLETQHGGIALSINNTLSVSAEVPPYLRFCAADTITNFNCSTATTFLVDMGDFNTKSASTGTSQFVASTNAQSGYSVTVSGTTLTSGNNIISSLANDSSSTPGTSQFGINLRANSSPSVGLDPFGPGVATVSGNYAVPNKFIYNDGDILVSSPTVSDNQDFTVSYMTNISPSQPAGVYSSTFSYICLANF